MAAAIISLDAADADEGLEAHKRNNPIKMNAQNAARFLVVSISLPPSSLLDPAENQPASSPAVQSPFGVWL
jgi:hypothetical protein